MLNLVMDEIARLQAAAMESEKARVAAERERTKAEGKLRQMQTLVSLLILHKSAG